jgi:hypothetical protein
MENKKISELTNITIPLDGSEQMVFVQSATTKKGIVDNIKTFLKTYFDTLYQSILISGTNIKTINGNSILGSGNLVVSSSNVVTEINTLGTVNTSTTETITYSLLIPANTISVGVYDCIFRSIRSSGTGSQTLKLYLNSTNTLVGASLVGQVPSTTTARYMALQKFVDVKVLNGTGLGTEVANVANSNTLSNDYVQHASVTGMGNISINWTNDVYLIATLTASVGTDVIRGTFLTLKK